MRRLLALTTALLAPLALVLDQPAAHAQGYPAVAQVKDRAGDAPEGIDLLSGRYQLSVGSARRATFQVRVKKLTDTTFLAFEVHAETEGWDRIAVYRENGRTVAKMYFIDTGEEYPVPTPVARSCPDLSVTWAPGRGEVTVTAPWRCFQAASSAYAPFGFQAYSRVGGRPGGAKDALPQKELDF